MRAKDNGGHAFPMPGGPKDGYGNPTNYPQFGMSLRDWFAGQIAADLVGGAIAKGLTLDDAGFIANQAYVLADALVAESKK